MNPLAPLIDVHAHLAAGDFAADLDAVLARARKAGVRGVIAVAETLEDARKNLELAERYSGLIYPAAGLYPTHLDLGKVEEMEAVIRAERNHWAAIGEVGLDYWKVGDDAQREVQREIFGRFVELAKELDLPLSVHSRSAGRHAVEFLLRRDARKAVLHAFDGKPSSALPAVEAGYLFSIPPSVVRSRQKQKLVARLPLSCLLLETDSPVLGPDSATRNEPANLRVALKAVAEIKGVEEADAAAEIARNAKKLFGDLFERN